MLRVVGKSDNDTEKKLIMAEEREFLYEFFMVTSYTKILFFLFFIRCLPDPKF